MLNAILNNTALRKFVSKKISNAINNKFGCLAEFIINNIELHTLNNEKVKVSVNLELVMNAKDIEKLLTLLDKED